MNELGSYFRKFLQQVEMLKRNDVPFQEEEFLALLALCEHPAQEQLMGMVLSEMREVLCRVCTCTHTHTTRARAHTHTQTHTHTHTDGIGVVP